jgi:hypothetical protein
MPLIEHTSFVCIYFYFHLTLSDIISQSCFINAQRFINTVWTQNLEHCLYYVTLAMSIAIPDQGYLIELSGMR